MPAGNSWGSDWPTMKAKPTQAALSPIASSVLEGLTSARKHLPPTLFYDAAGSALFEQITELPEYYPTLTELGIFEEHAAEMAASMGACDSVIELGAGSAKKTVLLLKEIAKRSKIRFYPVDVSESALEAATARVSAALPHIGLEPLVLDYVSDDTRLTSIPGRKLVLYIGSSIGNFEPFAASSLLRGVRAAMNKGDALLLGTDMRKDPAVLVPAYDDDAGVTAAFNKNLLVRINRELGGDFDLDQFVHRANWNDKQSRIEMHLESLIDQCVAIDALGLSVWFKRGESIHTENSYKFTMPMIEAMVENGGFVLEQTWSDPKRWFTVHLLRV